MRDRIAAVLCAGGLLGSAAAGAETYRVLDGALEDAQSGVSEPLGGVLEISVFEPEGQDVRPSLGVDDFQIEAGAQSFGPRQPVEYEGRSVLWIQLADQIQFDGDAVGLVLLRAGGERVAADESELTYRFVDFRSDARGGSRLVGHLGDTLLPRRIALVGTVYEVDQHFRILQGDCPTVPLPPEDGGGVIVIGGGAIEISGGGGRVISFEPFDIGAGEGVAFQPPDSAGVIARVTGGGSVIEGALEAGGAIEILDPAGVVFGDPVAPLQTPIASATAPTPTLEELGITAPDGAEVTFDETGALTVRTDGDLRVAGGWIDVPGLTRLTLIAGGSIVVEGTLEVPTGVDLSLFAGEVVIGGDMPDPGEIVIGPPGGLPFCTALRAISPPEEREIGRFRLLASAAQQVEIKVEPHGRSPRPSPRARGPVSVAILGSADLDIRDLDEDSLRLGPGEAPPLPGRGQTRRMDVNGDREPDLVVRFDARAAGIAGPAEVCLFGATRDGAAIEGCEVMERSSGPGSRRDPWIAPVAWPAPDPGRWLEHPSRGKPPEQPSWGMPPR